MPCEQSGKLLMNKFYQNFTICDTSANHNNLRRKKQANIQAKLGYIEGNYLPDL
jgi:hypothetical protein